MKFANPPLIEAVFEIKFKDPKSIDYELLLGQLYSELGKDYPYKESLKPEEMPAFLIPFFVQQRFRVAKDQYPLYQLGPGIVSYNANGKKYTEMGWIEYKKGLITFLNAYKKIAGEKFSDDNIEHLSLRYVNKIQDATMYSDIKRYFNEKLNIGIDLKFLTEEPYVNKLTNNLLSQTYQIDENTKLLFSAKTITTSSREILLDLIVKTNKIPEMGGIEGFLDTAHGNIENFFIKFTNGIKNLFA